MQSDAIKAKYLDGLVETTLVRDSGQLAAGHVNFPKKKKLSAVVGFITVLIAKKKTRSKGLAKWYAAVAWL